MKVLGILVFFYFLRANVVVAIATQPENFYTRDQEWTKQVSLHFCRLGRENDNANLAMSLKEFFTFFICRTLTVERRIKKSLKTA